MEFGPAAALGLAPQPLDDMLDAVGDGFYVLDAQFRFVRVNRRCAEIWGRPRAELIGRSIWDCFPGSADSKAGQQLRHAVVARQVVEYEVFSDVLQRRIWCRVCPVGGGLSAVHWRDVTDARRTEAALRDSEARFRQVFEQSPLGKATADLEMRFREVNPALCRMLGYSAEELVGKPLMDLVHPDDRDECLRQGRALLNGSIPRLQIEERFLHRSGQPLWVSVNVGPIRGPDGTTLYSLGIIEDIDERRRITQALQESQDRLRHLNECLEQEARSRARELAESRARLDTFFEMSLDWLSLFRSEPDGSFVYVDLNPACQRAYGLPREQVIGRRVQDILGEAQAEVPLRHLRECVRTGEPQRYLARRTLDGRTRTIDVVFVPVPMETDLGERLIVSTARDLTEREELEAQLRQAQKMEAVGELTGGVAHDFNNLLTAVIASMELIGRRTQDDRVRQLAGTALRAAMRGAQLTNQLLAFSRRQQLHPRLVALDGLIAEAGILLRRLTDETIELAIETDPQLWPARLDAAQFQAAVMNLVVNARDAMPDGGRMLLSLSNRRVPPHAAAPDLPDGDYVLLELTDTGQGMPPDVLARAAEPFFTTKPVGKGSGLGLSMVHGFASQSGGAMRIHSTPGQGTRVQLFLPRAAGDDSPEDAADLHGWNDAGPPATILLVEDNQDVRAAALELLHELGHTVLTARNGPDALCRLAEGVGADLLITDIVMPGGMSGTELARRARCLHPELRILLTSGYDADQSLQGAADFPFIAKPFYPAGMARMLRSVLSAAPAGRA
jgi:PAS domain S-box-containing protein